MTKEIKHIPVLSKEVLEYLAPKRDGVYIDATLGGGGHTESIVSCLGKRGRIIAIDRDRFAIETAKRRLGKYGDKIVYVQANFSDLDEILEKVKIKKVDGVLFDLGVSSYQLKSPERGFSFNKRYNAFLDMRMDTSQELRAFDVVNEYPEKRLREILYKLGEEPFARRIARQIVSARKAKPIRTTRQLLEIISRSIPAYYRFRRKSHWATNVFRAIRMEVNQELPSIKRALPLAIRALEKKGRLVVISFHSLEDRIVKKTFREMSFPQDNKPVVKILTKKPIRPSPEEVSMNPRSESAKLRAVEKL
ncbi:16S rRNA (cytosine(1402)-N(4))-methyltransferase RsmH [bacterium]|nr:16S rRNA (cytosine(1402)-N(4))-methyltransferase RsmH [bacterium]